MACFGSEHFDIQNSLNRKTFRSYAQAFFDERKYSMVPCEFPSKEQFPLYYEAKRSEFVIEEGEMLYIPAGWFHFVFSEDADPKTNLNFAVNFWYSNPDFVENGNSNEEIPKLKKHNISHIDPFKLYEGIENVRIFRCKKGKAFPSDRTWRHNSKESLSVEHMTFEEFYESRNPEYYVLQFALEDLKKYAPPSATKRLTEASSWINFGDVYSNLHYDLMDNWLCQIQGRKRVILFPPEERDKLYLYNNFPIEYCHTFQIVALGDPFIKRNQMSFRPFGSTTKDIEDSYIREFEAYSFFLLNMDCSPCTETKHLKPKFKEFSVEEETVLPRNLINIPYCMLWFLTEGKLQIRDYVFYVQAGEFFIFPNNMLYPCMIDKVKILYAYIEDGPCV